MNEIKKIGMYSTDEILEFMTEGEGRGFLGRSMFDAMYFNIKDLQSKIDKAIEKADELRKYIYSELVDFNVCGSTEAHCLAKDLLDILKEDK